jgi:hypothetical protein
MSPDSTESLRTLLRVVEALESLGIRYHLGGSFASSIHGLPRQTHDADLVAEMSIDNANALAAALGDDFYADVPAMREAVRSSRSFNVVDLESAFKVDVFVKGQDPFDREEFERAEPQVVDAESGRTIVVKSAEDTVLRKLQWFVSGGGASGRQWTDVVGILKVQVGRLDMDYMRRWAASLGIEEHLERALREAS